MNQGRKTKFKLNCNIIQADNVIFENYRLKRSILWFQRIKLESRMYFSKNNFQNTIGLFIYFQGVYGVSFLSSNILKCSQIIYGNNKNKI